MSATCNNDLCLCRRIFIQVNQETFSDAIYAHFYYFHHCTISCARMSCLRAFTCWGTQLNVEVVISRCDAANEISFTDCLKMDVNLKWQGNLRDKVVWSVSINNYPNILEYQSEPYCRMASSYLLFRCFTVKWELPTTMDFNHTLYWTLVMAELIIDCSYTEFNSS